MGSCGLGYSDPILLALITGATAFIDAVTGWFFEDRELEILLDGRGSHILQVPLPIIEIEKVEVVDPTYTPGTSELDLTSIVVYNRHLSGLTNPDDRKNPKIAFISSVVSGSLFMSDWPLGSQNIKLTGTFGFTEYDGGTTPEGVTPALIKEVCEMLAQRNLPSAPGTAVGGPSDPAWYERHMREQGRVIREKVRDQEIGFAAASASEGGNVTGIITGDPFIDMILLMYSAPPNLGWV
jgi:hypothetical protein